MKMTWLLWHPTMTKEQIAAIEKASPAQKSHALGFGLVSGLLVASFPAGILAALWLAKGPLQIVASLVWICIWVMLVRRQQIKEKQCLEEVSRQVR